MVVLKTLPIPNNQENQSKRRIKIIITIGVLLAVILGFVVYKIVANKLLNQSFKNVYFGKGIIDQYSLVNIATGQKKDFISNGYEIVDQHNYGISPDFLILKKGSELFSYNISNQSLVSIFSSGKDFYEVLQPSISEENKFFIEVYLKDVPWPSLRISDPLPPDFNLELFVKEASSQTFTRQSFFFDASSGKLSLVENIDFPGCPAYDSKNQRFLVWSCDSSVGLLPLLSIADLLGREIKKIISSEDFVSAPSDLTFVPTRSDLALNQVSGFFIAISKYDFSEIIAVDYTSSELAKEVYRASGKVRDGLNDFLEQTARQDKYYPHSMALAKDSNTFAVSGNSFILLLRFNSAKEITDYKVIAEKNDYSGSFFLYKDKLFWQSGDLIKVMDLDSWRLVKSLDSKREVFGDEISLFVLPD
jgi:hypothetical protein